MTGARVGILIILTTWQVGSAQLGAPQAAPSTFPFFGANTPQGRQVVFQNPIADQTLSCPTAGYFAHPQNCSQFYRCVDYLGIGQVFSRYMFHCPRQHVFLIGKDTCVPGKCSDLSGLTRPLPTTSPSGSLTTNRPTWSPTSRPSTYRPTRPPTSRPSTHRPTRPPTSGPSTHRPTRPPTSGPSTHRPTRPPTGRPLTHRPTRPPTSRPSTHRPTRPPTSRPATHRPTSGPSNPTTTELPPTTSAQNSYFPHVPASQVCSQGKYSQHARYCNVYHPCGNDQLNYACDIETAFDFNRQMCRIDEDASLCNGKEQMQINVLYKSILHSNPKDTHIGGIQDPEIKQNNILQTYNNEAVNNQSPISYLNIPQGPQQYEQGFFNPQVSPLFFQNPIQYSHNNLYYSNPQRVTVF